MAARTGKQYLSGLREQEREVWLDGERVRDVTAHPGLKNGARAIASLYDMQHDPKLRDEMTYVSPSSGERVGLSFIIPRTREDLENRRVMMLNWARSTCGMMGRSPDFMNVTYAAWAGASEFFAQGRPEFARNMVKYYEYIRENDLTLTHSLINLQKSRTVSGVFNLEEGTALQVVRETDAGIVVRGARILATLGPLADEIGVYSPRMGRHTEAQSPFALSFAIPCGTPGLRFLCRESFDLGRSHFDHPLGLALRGDGLRRLFRRRAGAVGAGVPAGRCRSPEPHGQRHPFLGAFGASGGHQEPRQMRIGAGRGIADEPTSATANCRMSRSASAS